MATGAFAGRAIGERPHAFGREGAGRSLVRLQVKHVVARMREHHAVGIDAGAAEHVADGDRPEAGQLIRDELLEAFARGHGARQLRSGEDSPGGALRSPRDGRLVVAVASWPLLAWPFLPLPLVFAAGRAGRCLSACAGDAPLALDRDAGGLVLGVELHMLGVFVGHGGQRLVLVELGVRIGLDLADDALQWRQRLATIDGFAGNLGRVAGVERDRDSRSAGPSGGRGGT